MPLEKERVTKMEMSANCPTQRCKDSVKYYKDGHNNGWELSFVLIIVGDIIDVEDEW